MSDQNEIEDYLDEDRPILGQKYVCLSFVSPDKLLIDKKDYFYYNYLKSNFGYEPKISLQKGIKLFIKWYKKYYRIDI